MKTLTLKEDLLKDFQEQKQMVSEQIQLVDPMAVMLRKPAAQRLFHNGVLLLTEILAWLLFLGLIAGILFMNRIFPFYYISQMMHDSALEVRYKPSDLTWLDWAIKGIIALLAIACLIIARMIASIRQKNNVLHIAGKNMKQVVEQLLKRRATIESFEQKYPLDIPASSDDIILPEKNSHNDILL